MRQGLLDKLGRREDAFESAWSEFKKHPSVHGYDELANQPLYNGKPGHATVLAEKATASGLFDRIVAIGGDGTINEVANGMIRACTQDKDMPCNYPALGIIPAGLGNDTARGLGISRGLNEACTVLIQGSTRYLDVGEVNSRFFINGVGYDGAVISEK